MLQLTIKNKHMKKLFVVLFLAIAVHSSAQTDEQKVLQRVKQLNEAIFGVKDSIALEGLMADKVTYGHSTGKLENRSEMISGAFHSTSTYKNLVSENATVYFQGKNTAIVRHILTAISVDKEGKESPLHLNILQVWIKQNRQWKLTARQAVKI